MNFVIRVLIENEAGTSTKNTFDERTFQLTGSVTVSRPYPYPYGFVINSLGGDGDAVDCFVIARPHSLTAGQIVSCCPRGLLEQIEDGEMDHKIIATLNESDPLPDNIRDTIAEFALGVFSHIPGKRMQISRLLGEAHARAYLSSRMTVT